MKKQTRVTHPPRVVVEPGNRPLVDPIYTSVKFTAESYADFQDLYFRKKEGFIYSRIANPSVRQLELLLAEIQGREDAIALSSGVAAITLTLLSLLQSGDHVIHFVESYKPSRQVIRGLLARYGVRSTMLSLRDHEHLERTLKTERSKLVLFESPTNPTLEIADLETITALAKTHGALTVMDDTFAGMHQHGEYPVDLYLHSLTKFAGGHGDTTGGVVIGNRPLIENLRMETFAFGAALDPQTAALVSRGMKTYFLRYERQSQTALKLARWLESHPAVTRLRYPGLESHPQHALAKRQMKDFGGVIAFDLKSGNVGPFLDRLKLFTLAASLGTTESLAAPGLAFYANDLSDSELARSGITEGTLRLSIGIEDEEDLRKDLAQALS